MTGTVARPRCYLCGSEDCSQVHETIRYGLPPRPYRCASCGLVFLSPPMQPHEMETFYGEVYRKHYVHEPPDQQFRASLPEARLRVCTFHHLLRTDRDLLEVGCAAGGFLHLAKDLVRSAAGVELTPEYVRYARDLGLGVTGSLDDLPQEEYDLVFLFHVLEHLPDPIGYLSDLRSRIRDGGRLVLEVPNVEDILVSVYRIKEHLDFYWEVAHQFYFSKETFSKVLERAGYRFTILPHQRYDLSNHMYWMLYRKPGGKGFFRPSFSYDLEQEYAKCLKDRFTCDTLIAVAQPED
jgi:SAM-dependent methyltransferase